MHPLRALTAIVLLLALAAPAVAATPAGDALVLRAPAGGLRLVDPATGAVLRNLPGGAVSADGATLLAATVHGGRTEVRRIAIRSGRVLARRSIAGAWAVQRAAADGTQVAGGEDGLPVALVAAGRAAGYRGPAGTTRIALLPATLHGPLRVLHLHGSFGVDAVAPDGSYLYLIEHRGGERYRVRAYDLRAHRLLAQVVVDKREPGERMQGLPLARTSGGGRVLTLYQRPSGVPFVHALLAGSLAAYCIDLPAAARARAGDRDAWGVALHGSTLAIANAATGWVGVVDLESLALTASVSLGPQTRTAAITRPLAVSPDGTRLYLARPQGLVVLAATTLARVAPFVPGTFGSLAVAASGLLYPQGRGTIQAVDPRTGALEGSPFATGRAALVGVAG